MFPIFPDIFSWPGGPNGGGPLRAGGLDVVGRARHRSLRYHGGQGYLRDLRGFGEEIRARRLVVGGVGVFNLFNWPRSLKYSPKKWRIPGFPQKSGGSVAEMRIFVLDL